MNPNTQESFPLLPKEEELLRKLLTEEEIRILRALRALETRRH
ncbi:MAG: hypothetical protein ACP5RJ_08770 [Conexivisphaera sp.]